MKGQKKPISPMRIELFEISFYGKIRKTNGIKESLKER
jgi:hypothetical protein